MVTTRRGVDTDASPSPIASQRSMTNGSPSKTTTTSSMTAPRTSPFLPTPLERIGLAAFPAVLVFGTLFSILSPETRAAPYDPVAQSHHQDPSVAPSYFARKGNLFNAVFVKRGWGWTSLAFLVLVLAHPALGAASGARRRVRAAIRWGLVTGWWIIVTQWCFGPPLIDRGFRWTGGRCELAEREVAMGDTDVGEMITAVACKAAGGKWKGGHDISGHVFLLVLSTVFVMEEAGWAVLRWSNWRPEERSIVMPDGANKGAGVEAETAAGEGRGQAWLGVAGKACAAVVGLNVWMLLMTAIYFHTWFEKLTGLVTAMVGFYAVYIVPRFVPGVRSIVGMPGI